MSCYCFSGISLMELNHDNFSQYWVRQSLQQILCGLLLSKHPRFTIAFLVWEQSRILRPFWSWGCFGMDVGCICCRDLVTRAKQVHRRASHRPTGTWVHHPKWHACPKWNAPSTLPLLPARGPVSLGILLSNHTCCKQQQWCKRNIANDWAYYLSSITAHPWCSMIDRHWVTVNSSIALVWTYMSLHDCSLASCSIEDSCDFSS